MKIKIIAAEFDPWQEIQDHQKTLTLAGKFGATCVFIGSMRDFNDGDDIKALELEHYPGMTEHQLGQCVAEAGQQWRILEALIVHRVGKLLPNDSIVLVAVWAAHRGDAYDANRYIMETLKSKAPFWKKETLQSDRQRWVGKNTDGYQAPQS